MTKVTLNGKDYYWYQSFLSLSDEFALIDAEGTIRATSGDLLGITEAKKYYGWGAIVRIVVSKSGVEFGEVLE